MTTELARWNLPDFQLQLDSNTELRVAKALSYIGGETAHTFLIWGTIGVEKNTYWEGEGHRTFRA